MVHDELRVGVGLDRGTQSVEAIEEGEQRRPVDAPRRRFQLLEQVDPPDLGTPAAAGHREVASDGAPRIDDPDRGTAAFRGLRLPRGGRGGRRGLRGAGAAAGGPGGRRGRIAIGVRAAVRIPGRVAAQGPQNGLTLDGAATLGYELADQLRAAGAAPTVLAVQVGGGALGASVALGLRRAVERGRLDRLPALHGVQTTGAAPLERADRLVHAAAAAAGSFEAALAHAARHRSSVMWPWEQPPHSIAGGILDDETYDWRALVDAMHASGGGPVVVTEEQLARANELGRAATGIDADHTGTAGLAGLLALAAAGRLAPSGDAVVLFTGQRR